MNLWSQDPTVSYLTVADLKDGERQLGFERTQKIGNIGIIANFVFPYISTFLLYLCSIIEFPTLTEIPDDD